MTQKPKGLPMDVRLHNRVAWDRSVERHNRWTLPVSAELVDRARRNEFELLLTPTKPVPRNWYSELPARRRCAWRRGAASSAGGGGRAVVTVFDNSPKQLGQDRFVAERDGLTIETVEGDMADLSAFADGSFGLIVHPVRIVLPQMCGHVCVCALRVTFGRDLAGGFCESVMVPVR